MEIDPNKATKADIIFLFGIDPKTLADWIKKGVPCDKKSPHNVTFETKEVFKWRIEREILKAKEDKERFGLKKGEKSTNDIKRLLEYEKYRRIKLENDEYENTLVNRKMYDALFAKLGSFVKDNLRTFPEIVGPQCDMKTGFWVTSFLKKEIEKVCNILSELKGFKNAKK